MQIFTLKINILLILLHSVQLISHFIPTQGKNLLLLNNAVLHAQNATKSTTYSPYLRRIKNPRFIGCRRQPWICNQDDVPRIKRLCCRDRCVDVSSDVNNCGLCGIRCRFTRQCCRGLCVNLNVNPFHCGRCDRRCRFPSFCFYGMCGYAQPLPPFPFPFPPRPPKPFPPKPFPPRPPKPFPPREPKPFPPRAGRRPPPPVE